MVRPPGTLCIFAPRLRLSAAIVNRILPETKGRSLLRNDGRITMGRYALLWLLGVPIPILLLIYLFGGLN